jgi:hypothetical protein
VAGGGKLEAGWRILITFQECHDVIDAVLLVLKKREGIDEKPGKAALVAARFGQYRHVRRHRAVVELARLRLVLPCGRRRKAVADAPVALEHFALIVRPVLDLVFGGNRGRLRRRKARSAGIGEITKREQG